MWYFSKLNSGFYNDQIHSTRPEDAIEITDAQHAALMADNKIGKNIVFDDNTGLPIAINPPAPTLQAQFEQVRLALQAAINTKARELGFSGGDSVIQYAGWQNAYQTTAITFGNWEVSVWVTADDYRDQVIAGTSPMLTPAEAVAMMPAYPA